MRRKMFVLFAFAFSGILAVQMALAEQTLAYPTADSAAFLISAPDDWKFTAAEEEGDYFILSGPTDATLYFRTVEADEDGIEEAIQETVDYVEEEYSNVKVAAAQEEEHNGMKGFAAAGTGTDQEDDECVFAFGWYKLSNGELVEIWFECEADDADGIAAAKKIVDTLKNP